MTAQSTSHGAASFTRGAWRPRAALPLADMQFEQPALKAFAAANPHLDLLTANFTGEAPLAKAGDDEARQTVRTLRSFQRLARSGVPADKVAALAARGITSAHQIAMMSRAQFAREQGDILGGQDVARAVHNSARSIQSRSSHAVAALKQQFSSHVRSNRYLKPTPELEAAVTGIPSYTELFGTLDYIEIPDCQSVLSPAAYLVDLMRIVTEEIIDENPNIPPLYQLKTRRPDVYSIELTCENTDTALPKIDIINKVLSNRLAAALGADTDYAIATRVFPFFLPVNLPLVELNATLAAGGTSRGEIYSEFIAQSSTAASMPTPLTASCAVLGLSVEQAAIVTTPSTGTVLAQYYGQSSALQLAQYVGQVSITLDASIVTGTGFAAGLANSVIKVAGTLRVVVSVDSATQLTVDCAWPLTASNVPAYSYPKDSIAQLSVFSAATGLATKQITRMLRQDLAPEEVAGSLAHLFFINAINPGMLYISLTSDSTDLVYSLDVLEEISEPNADRINRFLRLTAIVGWDYADLDFAIKAGGFADIGGDCLIYLAKLKALVARLGLKIDETCGLFADLKTYGRGETKMPADLFDRVYNTTAISSGHAPYRPVYSGNPLFGDPVKSWTVLATDPDNQAIRGWLAGSLQVSEGDLLTIAIWTSSATTQALDIPTLSRYYAFARLARALKWTVPALFAAMTFLKLRTVANIDDLASIVAFKNWLDLNGLTMPDIGYILTGATASGQRGVLDPAAIQPFLKTLRTLSKSWQLDSSSFVFTNIDAAESARIFDAAVAAKFIDSQGIAISTAPAAFEDLAPQFPVTVAQLISPVVSAADAQSAHGLLNSDGILNGDVLTAPVTMTTDLSFLFPNDPDRQSKTDSVQNVLVGTSSDCSHSVDILAGAFGEQTLGTYTQLGLLLADSVAMSEVVGAWALSPIGPPLELLLTDAGKDSEVTAALIVADRLAYAADKLKIAALDMASVLNNVTLFGFADLGSLGLADLQLLVQYAQLLRTFTTSGVALASYLTVPVAPLAAKMEALQALTGWVAAQSEQLVTALWGTAVTFNTIPAIMTMLACFASAKSFGAAIPSLIALAGTASLPRMPLPTIAGGDAASWAAWKAAADASLQVFKSKYDDAAWPKAYAPIHDAVAEARRDALVALGVLLIQQDVPQVNSPRTLSEYLLIDVEAGACNVTTCILETTAAAQMYVQRCRLALEPYVTSVEISDLTWSWISNYRVWEANRKIFIYPESYLNPSLRKQCTPLFQKLKDQLQQNEITDASVTNAFTQYMNSFAELATIQSIDSIYCTAPDPDTGEPVDQVIVIGRSAAEPYSYYSRTLELPDIWSAWHAIDSKISAPTVTPVFAQGRLFIFWVETTELANTAFDGGTQTSSVGINASILYSFQKLDKTWSAPQSVLSDVVFKYLPDTYSTGLINPSSTNSLTGIDSKMPYWYRPFVVIVPAADGTGEQLVVSFGNAYQAVNGTATAPTAGTDLNLNQLNTSIWNAASLANAAVAASASGSVVAMPVGVLDTNLEVTQTWAFYTDQNTTSSSAPFGAGITNSTFTLMASQNLLVDNMLSYASDYYTRVYKGGPTTPCLYSLAPAAVIMPTKNIPGWWIFNSGEEAFLAYATQVDLKKISSIVAASPGALAISSGASEISLSCGPYSSDSISVQDLVVQFVRLSTGAVDGLSQRLLAGGIDSLLTIAAQEAPGPSSLCFARFYSPLGWDETGPCNPQGNYPPPPPATIPPSVLCGGQVDFHGAYRPYFEEIFFQAPFLIATMLNANQRFAEAKRWYDFIFDPTAAVTQVGEGPEVFWQFLPFRQNNSLPSLQEILSDNDAILRWNRHPFDPFAVADLRMSAYKKTIVMHYIDNLLDWGDQLFSLDTRESLNQALLLYLMAYDLLGPRPRARGVMPAAAPINFSDIETAYPNHIPQFLIELEHVLPTPAPSDTGYAPAPFNLINGYFGVGENKDFIAYWTRVEDRLYKLRNCMNLAGVVRQLPFYQPPIDPNQLVAAASGSDMPLVVDHGPQALPNYRFQTMVERAKSVVQTLTGFGASLLSALEKMDAERLSMLRMTQERQIVSLTTRMKELQVSDAEATIASLTAAKDSAAYRSTYYQQLHVEGLSPAEATSIAMMVIGAVYANVGGAMRAMSGAAHLIPNVGSPFAMTYGGVQIGFAFDALAALYETVSRDFDFASSLSSVLAGYQRRDQEWVMQHQVASYEVTQMEAQLLGAQARLEMAQRDLAINAQQIVQADDMMRAVLDKFTNEELYNWMVVRLSVLYFQTYRLAFDMAMAAQRAYQFELDTNATFIDFGYWDSRRKGLLAGEGLLLSLGQLERAYLAGNSRRLSVTKTISLRNLDPSALLRLQSTGSCIFSFSELLFDLDFPGQYCRKIESLTITVPAVIGPYQDLHGTLTQTGNTILLAPSEQAVLFLLGQETSTPVDGVLRLNWRCNQEIALSRAVDENGMASGLSGAADDRYVPFEGTGAISNWILSLPKRNNAFNFDALTDVIMTLTYSAQSGGASFQAFVRQHLPTDYSGAVLINLAQQYSSAWYAFMNPQNGQENETLSFNLPRGLFPANLQEPISFTNVLLQLIVENTTFVGPMPATLAVPEIAKAFDLVFELNNPSVSTPVTAALDTATPWVFSVKRTDIPAELKTGDRFDPNRLTGLYLLLTYNGTYA